MAATPSPAVPVDPWPASVLARNGVIVYSNPAGDIHSLDMWGVAIDPETGYIYGSEMRTGLWIIDPTGDAEPD